MATTQAGQFAGKVAFVTGAGTGIGRAAALAFAREGAQVAVVGITPADNEETLRLVTEQGGLAVAVTCDTTDEQQVQD
ncbi:MAG: SDR family NAD(P)-dependent oxidoreductase, partial [Hymenobacter sp.]